ncbi:MAG: hypothetical protein RLZZ398_590 [Verrucomicrobiota bacterium]|jgi:hypothetical protein
MNSKIPTALFLITNLAAHAGPYAGAAGTVGSTAIHKDSPLFVNWANGHLSCEYGADVEAIWRTPTKAYGKAEGTSMDIVCLGNGGSITLIFPLPIRDGAGADFAIFENAISDYFLELAFVEVSSDGTHYFRFPTASLTEDPVGPFADVNPTEVDGFAAKYRQGYGTPFDLSTLPTSASLDKQNIRYVRILDIIGTGATKDSLGRAIYDPTHTTGSGGFDLDAVGVIHQNEGTSITLIKSGLTPQGFLLRWQSSRGRTYRIETSADLKSWQTVETITGAAGTTTERVLPLGNDTKRYWRVVRP